MQLQVLGAEAPWLLCIIGLLASAQLQHEMCVLDVLAGVAFVCTRGRRVRGPKNDLYSRGLSHEERERGQGTELAVRFCKMLYISRCSYSPNVS